MLQPILHHGVVFKIRIHIVRELNQLPRVNNATLINIIQLEGETI